MRMMRLSQVDLLLSQSTFQAKHQQLVWNYRTFITALHNRPKACMIEFHVHRLQTSDGVAQTAAAGELSKGHRNELSQLPTIDEKISRLCE
jgi:hypothetical protein